MKHLNDYINERRVDEAGLRDTLFGSIVLKIVDAGLSWIGKAGAWLADSFKAGLSEGWKTVKGLQLPKFNDWGKRHGYNGKMPSNEKEFAEFFNEMFINNKNKSLDERYKAFINFCEISEMDIDSLVNMSLPMFISNATKKNATTEDFTKSILYLRKLSRINGISSKTKSNIEDAIKDLSAQMKKTNDGEEYEIDDSEIQKIGEYQYKRNGRTYVIPKI